MQLTYESTNARLWHSKPATPALICFCSILSLAVRSNVRSRFMRIAERSNTVHVSDIVPRVVEHLSANVSHMIFLNPYHHESFWCIEDFTEIYPCLIRARPCAITALTASFLLTLHIHGETHIPPRILLLITPSIPTFLQRDPRSDPFSAHLIVCFPLGSLSPISLSASPASERLTPIESNCFFPDKPRVYSALHIALHRIVMAKPKSVTISAPFDARHVGGVNIPGAMIPISGVERSSTTLEPDITPSHTFVAHGNTEIPWRSNTIATSISRPSLKLKTSMSLLRGRSNSSADRTSAKREETESPYENSQADMSAHSLRTKTSRFWHKTHHESPLVESAQKEEEVLEASRPVPLPKDLPILGPKQSLSPIPSIRTAGLYTYDTSSLPPLPPVADMRPIVPPRTSSKLPLTVRPKRADSGTAIDFDDVLTEERPLGFKEILVVHSHAERMALYKKTREYWAHADYGLNEWVYRTGTKFTVPI